MAHRCQPRGRRSQRTNDRSRAAGIADPISRLQVETLDANAHEHAIRYFDIHDQRQGIVHVIGPEQGATLPGMTVVCGDSHTSTHGAFACLAFGIGTSEVEHVLATQSLMARKMKNMLVRVEGRLGVGVTAKDLVLAVIGQIGTAGGTGYAIEFAGSTIRSLSMEGRMTVCNMTIEAGARVRNGRGRRHHDRLPEGSADVADRQWTGTRPLPIGGRWSAIRGAKFDRVIEIDATRIHAAGDLGHVAGDGASRSAPGCPIRIGRRIRSGAKGSSGRCSTWASNRTR